MEEISKELTTSTAKLEKEGDKENKDVAAQVAGDLQAKELWYKQGLPTTISPERRSLQRKKAERAGVPARKFLGFGGTSQSVLDRTQIKVLVLNPNQCTERKSNVSDESVSNSEHCQEEVANCGQHCLDIQR